MLWDLLVVFEGKGLGDMALSGSPGKNGIDGLYRSVGDRHVFVLWHRLWLGGRHGFGSYGVHSAWGLFIPGLV